MNGRLPEMDAMSWRIRVDEQTLISEFEQLARLGLLDYNGSNPLDQYWFVVNFEKRQARLTGAARVSAYRKRAKKREYYEGSNEDETSRYTEEEVEEEEEEEQTAGAVFASYLKNIGALTDIIKDDIIEELKRSSPVWIIDAIKIALENNVRKWSYVVGILNRWHTNGRSDGWKKEETKAEEYERIKVERGLND